MLDLGLGAAARLLDHVHHTALIFFKNMVRAVLLVIRVEPRWSCLPGPKRSARFPHLHVLCHKESIRFVHLIVVK